MPLVSRFCEFKKWGYFIKTVFSKIQTNVWIKLLSINALNSFNLHMLKN